MKDISVIMLKNNLLGPPWSSLTTKKMKGPLLLPWIGANTASKT